MKIVAVTSCPSGVAHTYMAAEAIEKAAKAAGIGVKVETQGSIGIENELTASDISEADVVVITKDMDIKNTDRFKNSKVVKISIGDAIKKAPTLMQKIKDHVEKKNS
ncbi:PTS fructose-like transporter subunit IIB [Alkalibaculum sp. M08DMB]|uniref:PTS fructose-like transporter subunit IIB n=1 Tax=Alkalibaculum sporogenes TaxID=2655001 RepID=A0A6A7K8F7_9FIRM|nr:PTS fructose-like transporter subunit IIB [Alkalibaculum sporogenes]MPW25666.1 PTS fructose-like transporter subunit IIB [Alkalibaculum sporogenes]